MGLMRKIDPCGLPGGIMGTPQALTGGQLAMMYMAASRSSQGPVKSSSCIRPGRGGDLHEGRHAVMKSLRGMLYATAPRNSVMVHHEWHDVPRSIQLISGTGDCSLSSQVIKRASMTDQHEMPSVEHWPIAFKNRRWVRIDRSSISASWPESSAA
jgi:hypothetical protein